MDDFTKLLSGAEDIDDKEKMSKMAVIKELVDELSDLLQEEPHEEMPKMPDMQKVTVAAPDEESLESGLGMAKDLISEGSPMDAFTKKRKKEDED